MNQPVRIGICGLGMGKSHALAAHIVDNVELVAIAEMNPGMFDLAKEKAINKKGEGAGDFYDTVERFTDYKEMITSGKIEAVVLALPTHLHTEASLFALENGIHVQCEKPPTITTDEMLSIYHQVKETGLTYGFVRQARFNPPMQTAKRIVAAGTLGNIYHAESKWCRTGCIPFRQGYGVNKDSGGGALLDLGIHSIDNAWYTMGCPRPIEVMSIMHSSFAHLGESQGLEVPYTADDMTQGLIRFENGASLVFNVTFVMNSAGQSNKTIEGQGSADWQELYLYGDKAGIDLYNNKFITRADDSKEVTVEELEEPRPQKYMGMEAQINNFAHAVQTGCQPENTVEQALMLMQMLEALFQSAEQKKSITLENITAQLIEA